MDYDAYLKTDYWKAVAEAVKKRAGYRCQICNSKHGLDAHHRTYEHKGNELEYLDDLTCLCRICHGAFHGKTRLAPIPYAARPKSQIKVNLEMLKRLSKWLMVPMPKLSHTPEEVKMAIWRRYTEAGEGKM